MNWQMEEFPQKQIFAIYDSIFFRNIVQSPNFIVLCIVSIIYKFPIRTGKCWIDVGKNKIRNDIKF